MGTLHYLMSTVFCYLFIAASTK